MFWRSRNQRAEALNTYWNTLVVGQEDEKVVGNDSLALLIRQVNDSDFSPAPVTTFVHSLEAQLLGQHGSQRESSLVDQSPAGAVAPAVVPRLRLTEPERTLDRFWRNRRSRWSMAGAACAVLMLIVIAGAIVASRHQGPDSGNESLIPAVVDRENTPSPQASSPGSLSGVTPLSCVDFDRETLLPGATLNWASVHFFLVDLRPNQSQLISVCPGCQSLSIVMVLDGEVTIRIDGPVSHVAEKWEIVEPFESTGNQVLNLSAGDAVILDVQDTIDLDGIINESARNSQLLIGSFPDREIPPVFAIQPTIYSRASAPVMSSDDKVHLSIQELVIQPNEQMEFDVIPKSTDLYLLHKGAVSATTQDGLAPPGQSRNTWRAPTSPPIASFAEGTYLFHNDESEPAYLYKMSVVQNAGSVDGGPLSDAPTLEECPADKPPAAPETTVVPLAGAEIDPDLITSDAARYWLAGNWSLVEFKPDTANVIGLCPDCKSLTFIFVMEGQLSIEVVGPALRVARNFEAVEPEDIGHQMFQLNAGDAVITDLTSTEAGSQVVPAPDTETRLLMGVLSTYASSFTSEATLYTSGRLQPAIGDGLLGLFMDEITIDPGSRFAFEKSTCQTEIYLLTSGMLTVVPGNDTELSEELATAWEGPSGIRIDQFPEGGYDFRNEGSETAHLYRWTIAYPSGSAATPAACS